MGQRDILFKPVPSLKGPREVLFYKNVFGSHFSEVPKEVIALKELVPKYYGTHDIVDRAGTLRILPFWGGGGGGGGGGDRGERMGRGRVGT